MPDNPNEVVQDNFAMATKSAYLSGVATAIGQPADVVKVLRQLKLYRELPYSAVFKRAIGYSPDKTLFEGFIEAKSKHGVMQSVYNPLMRLNTGLPLAILRQSSRNFLRTYTIATFPLLMNTHFNMRQEDAEKIMPIPLSILDLGISNVLDRLKTAQIAGLSKEKNHSSIKEVVSGVAPTEAAVELTRGSSATIAKSMLSWGMIFAFHDIYKNFNKSLTGNNQLSGVSLVSESVIFSLLKVGATTPIDVVKNNMQASKFAEKRQFSSMLEIAKDVHLHSGVKGFFSGFSIRLFHSILSSTVGFYMLDIIKENQSLKRIPLSAEISLSERVKESEGLKNESSSISR